MDLPAANPLPPKNRPVWASFLWGCVLGVFAAGGAEIVRMVSFHNQHVVMPGLVYRTGQLQNDDLRAIVAKKQIRTLVNLRGRPISDWYPAECASSQELGISQEDITSSANRLPSPLEICRLIEVFDRSEYPILLHCQQGADRTGLASATWQLLYTDADYETARRQCSPRYGHFRVLTTANMDLFFDLYEEWLSARHEGHSPANFREWATRHYKPGVSLAKLELINSPVELPASEAIVFRLRATNLSDLPWEMSAGTLIGVHARYWVYDVSNRPVYFGQAGFQNGVVRLGEAVELPLPIPAMPGPGKYRLLADLSRQNYDFFQYGSEPLNYEWNAVDPAKPVK
ncbi:tyrosine-protein phosphatase [Zavarzinella formosa]|uniref:tyrosine-protein phosphatase n=1 Tax=Zavarzinella formosa TaxID=360055 RepID=UPI00030FA02E|nr:tyrosine-protein phosphatase [Zavarzinella formosa]